MEIIKKLTIKQWIIAGILIFAIFGTIGIYFYKNIYVKNDEYELFDEIEDYNINNVSDNSNNIENTSDDEEMVENYIIVHITGCIKKQGIVTLKQGERIVDAIEKAGGATEEADLDKINLAYELQDGEKLYIPSKYDENSEIDTTKEYVSSGENNYVSGSYSSNSNKNSIININKASSEELQTLNGIGESMASKIIKYREENGDFEKIEDIKNVPGIGDAKFNNIKDYITVK